MGEERDRLLRRLGETPLSEEKLSDNELMARRMESYSRKKRLPPEIAALRDRMEEGGSWLVGYGTLLNRASLEATVGEEAKKKPFVPVVVQDHRRLFNLVPDTYEASFRVREDPVEVAAANVRPEEGARFNGLAIPVSGDELEALDRRERFYERVRVDALGFDDGEPLGRAFLYSAPDTSPWVPSGKIHLLPRWKDVVLARRGAYVVGRSFGQMYDATTFLADGRTPLLSVYEDWLRELEEGDGA